MDDEARQEHIAEVDRLWELVRRDLGEAILELGGLVTQEPGKSLVPATTRLVQNWAMLCELDLDVAAGVWDGLGGLTSRLARRGDPHSPSDHADRQFEEALGVARIGRKKNPDAGVQTVAELYALGVQAIADEVDEDIRRGEQ